MCLLLKRMKREIWFLVFFVLMIFSFFFDREVMGFASGFGNENLDLAAEVLSHLALFVVVLFICSYLLWDKKKITYLWGGVGFSYVISLVLKFFVQRIRPIESELSSFSFPSSHATVYFFIFAFMTSHSEKYKWVFLVLAVLVSISRVYLGLHYLSDVIGGGLLGIGLYYFLRKWIKT